MFNIIRHIAQNQRKSPIWFDFEQRQEHDLDALARKFIDDDLGSRALIQALQTEYDKTDRYWKVIYYSFSLFKSQYDSCANRILIDHEEREPSIESEDSPLREVSDEIKAQVKQRDGYRCVCCGSAYRLEVDHIIPQYYGGDHSLNNLQTLCHICHKIKGLETINFRTQQTFLKALPIKLPDLEIPRPEQANNVYEWEYFLRRTVNFLYHCNAVKSVKPQDGWATHSWEISLRSGNNLRWLKQHQEELKSRIRQGRERAKFYGRVTITIIAPKFDIV